MALLELHRLTRPTWNPPPRFSVSEWSEKFRYLSREYAAQPGRFSLNTVPYAKEPMDCANDPTVRVVVLMWASQTIKTTCLENVCGYFIAADPAPILLVQPTVEMAQAWSKERLNATVRDTPVLREVLTDQKSRDSGNTIQLKTFPGGNLAIIGANAPAGLAGRPRRVVLLDEVDRYPLSAGTEGDPVALAIRRTESFWNSVIYLTSTPTTKGASRIESEYEQTDKCMWFVPCPKCRAMQSLKWKQVHWENNDPETACLVCEFCSGHWTDRERVDAIRKGEWRATAPFSGKRGYFLNGLYSPFKPKRGFKSRLSQMVCEFQEAKKGGIEQLKTWTNTFLAETWEEAAEKGDHAALLSRAEDYSPQALPEDVILLTAQCDVQKTWVQVEILGHGFDEETWGVSFEKIEGDTEQEDVWADLSERLRKTYKRSDGVELAITAVAIDMRHKGERVRKFVRNCGLPRVWPVYGAGAGSHAATHPVLVTSRFDKRHQMRTYAVATREAKDALFARMKIDDQGPRFMHFPKGNGYSEEYFRQLAESEVKKTKYLNGFPVQFYEKVRERNEALDLRVYGLACIDILKPNFTAIAAKLKPNTPPEPPKEYVLKPEPQIKTQPTAPAWPKFKAKGGFIGGWK